MLSIFVVHQTTHETHEIHLNAEQLHAEAIYIGRQPGCAILLPDSTVSRKHAQITLAGKEVRIVDLHSSGGTFYQGAALVPEEIVIIQEGADILIGPYQLRFNYAAQQQDQTQFPDEGKTKVVVTKLPNFQPVALVKAEDWQYWDGQTIDVTCSKIFRETHDVKTFIFTAAPNLLFRYKPGQFATLHLTINGKPVIRSYSISSTPSRPHYLSVTVKQVPAVAPHPPGLVSNWLHSEFKVGQKIQISGPYGEFSCHLHPAPKLLLVSGGSGVTPMLSMTRWLCDTASNVDIVFLHVAKTALDIVARDELEMLAARHANLKLVFSVTQDKAPSSWAGWRGRISADLLNLAVADFKERRVFVCGPEAFMESTKEVLLNLNFPMH
ncbi:MAG TPA: FAD-binding oxidoreductase, partial [Cellvibrionaceae bacterium]|nr:FAD-binding oxidoreductase [Cellvibrionaceae bacterium]